MNELIAIILYTFGKKPCCSCFIDEDTITLGYGKLHSIGTWQYQLPYGSIKKIMGTLSWKEYIQTKKTNKS